MEYLQKLVNDYQPTEATKQLVASTRIALFAGISGAGKNTIKQAMIGDGAVFHDIVSHTTRPPRQNNGVLEVDGRDYHFIDNQVAQEMLESKAFVEAKFVHGTVYGTSVAEIEQAKSQNKVAITDIDVQGVAEMKLLAPDAVSIFIVPPSYEVWLERLKSRYVSEDEFVSQWPKRRDSSIRELRHALEVPYYHFIINDELDRAVRVSEDIITREDVFYEKDNEARILAQQLLEMIEDN